VDPPRGAALLRWPRLRVRLPAPFGPQGAAGASTRLLEAPPEDVAELGAQSPSGCPSDMVLIQGEYCPYLGHVCDQWLDQRADRCARYRPNPVCAGRPKARRFCIDRYEYPNLPGVYPLVMTSWIEAQAACEAEGKRLCKDSEWTLACEGQERLAYPYGHERDAQACNIDRDYRFPDLQAFDQDRRISAEVQRLDQRVPSGSMRRCISPFGVYDTTGNVDEWVINEEGKPDVSGLKGGYFGPIRARCRPMTTAHNRWFRFYQVGFRCCAEAATPAGDDNLSGE
jgi:sulfatase modifying factor 1